MKQTDTVAGVERDTGVSSGASPLDLPKRVSDNVVALSLFLVFGAFFAAFAAREPLWGDSSKLSIYVLESDYGIRGLTSGMGHHTLTVAAGRLLTDLAGLQPHRSLALVSALCGAVSVMLLYRLLRGYGISRQTALWCVFSFGLAHMNLFVFTVQESYAPMLALWLGILACFRVLYERPSPWASITCGALLGLSIANHSLSVILYGLVLYPTLAARHGLRRSLVATGYGLAGFAAAFLPIFLFLMKDSERVNTFGEEIGLSLAAYMNIRALPKGLVFFVIWLAFQLPLMALVMVAGVRRLKLPRLDGRNVHLALLAATALFTSVYMIQRRMLMMTICLPSVLVLAGGMIDRMDLSARRIRRLTAASVVFNAVVYMAVSAVLSPLVTRFVPELRVNHWRPASYYFQPFAHLSSDPAALRDELDELFPASTAGGRSATFLMDFTFVKPLEYYRMHDGWRSDLRLIDVDHWFWLPQGELPKRTREAAEIAARERTPLVLLPYPDRILGRLKMEELADIELRRDHAIVKPKPELFPAR